MTIYTANMPIVQYNILYAIEYTLYISTVTDCVGYVCAYICIVCILCVHLYTRTMMLYEFHTTTTTAVRNSPMNKHTVHVHTTVCTWVLT